MGYRLKLTINSANHTRKKRDRNADVMGFYAVLCILHLLYMTGDGRNGTVKRLLAPEAETLNHVAREQRG